MKLSPGQRDAVFFTDHHLMIEAGAGSGKTTTLVEKLLYETGQSDRGDPPERKLSIDEIVAVTFTRKAAGEIKDRLRSRILHQAESMAAADRERRAIQAFKIDNAEIGTIDRLANRIVRDYGPYAGVDAGYQLLDETDAETLRLEVAGEAVLDAVDERVEGATGLVRHFGFLQTRRFVAEALDQPNLLRSLRRKDRRRLLGLAALRGAPNRVDELIAPLSDAALQFLLNVQDAYQTRLVQEGVLDFPSMALAAAKVVRSPEARDELTKRVRLLVVDEHQDTSPLQAELLFAMAGLPRPGVRAEADESIPAVRLVLIGDPKQSIYSFRHADILQWKRSRQTVESAGGRYVPLDQSFRATASLTRFHDVVLGKILADTSLRPYDIDYQGLQPNRTEPGPAPVEVLLAEEPDTPDVAALVGARIRRMLDEGEEVFDRKTGERRPVVPGDIAILARELKTDAAHYVQALHDNRIDFRVVGGGGLYQRQEVLDVAALLSAVADPHDPYSLAAFLRSPFGAVDDQTLNTLAVSRPDGKQSGGSLLDALRDAAELIESEERRTRAREALEVVQELRALRDRVGHDELIRKAVDLTGYEAYLAGAPDAPLGLRNLAKLIRIAGSAEAEPLSSFVDKLGARIARAEREEEAPLYATDEDLVTLSTIHSAKGLEWPVVIVTQLHDRVVRSVRRDRGPRLSDRLGVVLPLDVVIREGGHDTRVSEPSRLWDTYAADQIARDYAEAKRLFYVACTRARDRLILAGALNEAKGWGLVSRPDYRTSDKLDRWLQIVVPPITETAGPEAEFDFRYVPFRVLRPAPAQVQEGEDPDREWPGVLDLTGPTPPPEGGDPLLVRTGPVDQGPIRTEFAVSEFLQFNICPWKHFYGYRAGVSSPRLEATPDASIVSRILPERRGDILHHYFGQHKDDWSEEKMRSELKRILLWHIPMDEEQAEENVGELLGHVRNYLNSDVHSRVREARARGASVYREVPFIYRFRGDIRVRGILDLLFEEPDGWVAVDYKTGLFGKEEAEHERTVQVRTERYRIQAAIYSLAVNEALDGRRLKRFHFFFTPPGLESSIPVTDEWPVSAHGHVLEIVERIRASDYGGEPTFAVERCVGCEYRPICRPEAFGE